MLDRLGRPVPGRGHHRAQRRPIGHVPVPGPHPRHQKVLRCKVLDLVAALRAEDRRDIPASGVPAWHRWRSSDVAPSGVESARRVLGLAVERLRWVAEAPRAREEAEDLRRSGPGGRRCSAALAGGGAAHHAQPEGAGERSDLHRSSWPSGGPEPAPRTSAVVATATGNRATGTHADRPRPIKRRHRDNLAKRRRAPPAPRCPLTCARNRTRGPTSAGAPVDRQRPPPRPRPFGGPEPGTELRQRRQRPHRSTAPRTG